MKLRTVVLALSLSLSLTACEKTSDVTAMQEEATGIASTYKAQFDAMALRFKALDERSRKIDEKAAKASPDFPLVSRVATETQAKLTEMQALASAAPGSIKTAATGDKARPELIRITGDLRVRFQAGALEINRNLDVLESWLANQELSPSRPAPAPAPAPEPAPAPDAGSAAGSGSAAAPAPAGEEAKPAGAGSAAPAPKADDKAAPKADDKAAPKPEAKAAPKAEPKPATTPAAGSGSAAKPR